MSQSIQSETKPRRFNNETIYQEGCKVISLGNGKKAVVREETYVKIETRFFGYGYHRAIVKGYYISEFFTNARNRRRKFVLDKITDSEEKEKVRCDVARELNLKLEYILFE